MLSLAEFKPLAGRNFVKPPQLQICGLAEFKPKLLLSRLEIYSKPAWGSSLNFMCQNFAPDVPPPKSPPLIYAGKVSLLSLNLRQPETDMCLMPRDFAF